MPKSNPARETMKLGNCVDEVTGKTLWTPRDGNAGVPNPCIPLPKPGSPAAKREPKETYNKTIDGQKYKCRKTDESKLHRRTLVAYTRKAQNITRTTKSGEEITYHVPKKKIEPSKELSAKFKTSEHETCTKLGGK